MIATRRRSGFSTNELVIALLSVGLLALLGYVFYVRLQGGAFIGGTAQSAVASDVPSAPKINSKSDLDKAITTLAGIDPGEDEDGAQLEDELNSF